MLYYYCTCTGKKHKYNDEDRESRGFRLTKINKEGLCQDCGYYTIVLTKKVGSRPEMSKVLKLNSEDQENYYIGESIIEQVKQDFKDNPISKLNVKKRKSKCKKKLSEKDIEKIKKMSYDMKQTDIAKVFKVSRTTIGNALKGKKHDKKTN